MKLIFSIFQTCILQATAGRKIQFKLGKIQFIKLDTYFKLENWKNQVQIDRGLNTLCVVRSSGPELWSDLYLEVEAQSRTQALWGHNLFAKYAFSYAYSFTNVIETRLVLYAPFYVKIQKSQFQELRV